MPTVHNFAFTGAPQSVVVPAGVNTAVLEVWGASGADVTSSGGPKGLGAYVQATITDLVPGETLYVYVGGEGVVYVGGWNGGGNGKSASVNYHGMAGGGATDIRRGGSALADRIVVGGGGGGPGNRDASRGPGGHGGYPAGGSGGLNFCQGGTQVGPGANDTSGVALFGTLGQGAHSTASSGTRRAGGGGGGLWGGNSSTSASNWGAGGGSSYYDPELTDVTAEAVGTWDGAGKATITFDDPVSFLDTELVIAEVTAAGGEVVIPRRSTPRRELLWISDLSGVQVGVIG